MNSKTYLEQFDEILNSENKAHPYHQDSYLEYLKLNNSRVKRWMKSGEISETTSQTIKNINSKQNWVLITEHWCGDAAHSVPFIIKMAELNDNINLEIQLRDSNSEIEQYLTNGGKSIPILIIRDENNKDIAIWGPRPKACQNLFLELKHSNKSEIEQKSELQNWYNHNKGVDIQNEIVGLVNGLRVNS